MSDAISSVNAAAGIALAILLGIPAALARPPLALVLARPALLGLLAGLATLLVGAVPVDPVAGTCALAFASAYWAAAPVTEPAAGRGRGWARPDARSAAGAILGLSVAAGLAVLSAFDLFWALPILGLAIGAASAAGQAVFLLVRRLRRM